MVVGIDDYAALGEGVALRGAAADADRVARYLTTELGFEAEQVLLMTDAEATVEAITAAVIDGLIAGTRSGDRAVLYFAGLGEVVADESGLPTAALVAHDAHALLGRLPGDLIGDFLDLVPARDVTVIVDATFAAAGFPPPPAFGQGAAERAIWMAAGIGAPAWEAQEGDGWRGVFTAALLDGLGGAADADGDGAVANAELLAFVERRSRDWCTAAAACAVMGPAPRPVFAGPPALASLAAPGSAGPAAMPPQGAGAPRLGLPADRPLASRAELVALVAQAFLPANAAGLRISRAPDGPLQVGDEVSFAVEADRPGRLLLLDVGEGGELTALVPSGLAAGDAVGPGRPLAIPGTAGADGQPRRLRVSEPAGRGFLLGVLVGDGGAPPSVLPDAPAGAAIPALLRDLRRLDPTGDAAWSAAWLPYEIAR